MTVEDADEPATLTAAWYLEILARLERYDRGETTAIPADEVFDRLERRFGRVDTIGSDE